MFMLAGAAWAAWRWTVPETRKALAGVPLCRGSHTQL